MFKTSLAHLLTRLSAPAGVQVDRFLALYWNSSYKARVSPGLATRITAASKLALAALTLALSKLDPHTFRCHARVRVALCGHFRYLQKYLEYLQRYLHSFILQTRERVLPHPAHERLCARGGGRHSLRAETHPQVQQYLY